MMRPILMAAASVLALSACEPVQRQPQRLGPDGRPLPTLYPVARMDPARVQGRMLEAVNNMRRTRGLAPLALSAELNAAAFAHSRDMSAQDRAWNFGSDGSSPVDRANRAGFIGFLVGENVSETFENEVETLAEWSAKSEAREIILEPSARLMGLGWHQDANGKIWWTQVIGG